ncbi:MAG: hypothetical protein ACREMY_16370, partial [bacterium]
VHVVVQPKADVPTSDVPTSDAVPVAPAPPLTPPASPGTIGMGSPVPRASAIPCPPVGFDLSLVKLRDGTQRVIASSKDGAVLDSLSVDTPVVNIVNPKVLRWSLDGLYGSSGRVGGLLTREVGPFHVSAGALHQLRGADMIGVVGFGLRF